MFIVALFTITKVWEQPKYSSIDEWINKMWLHTHKHTHTYTGIFSSVQSLSHSVVSDSLRPYELQHARPPCPSPTPRVLLKPMSIKLVMPSSRLILCHPLLLLTPILPSIRVFSNESTLRMRWPKYWSFSFSISTLPQKGVKSCHVKQMDDL